MEFKPSSDTYDYQIWLGKYPTGNFYYFLRRCKFREVDEIELYYCHHLREKGIKIRYGGIRRSGNVMIRRPDDIVKKYLQNLKSDYEIL